MKDYAGVSIFELMKVPTEKLKELTIEEFAKEIRTKAVNIHPIDNNKYSSKPSGDIYIDGINVQIYINEYTDGYRMSLSGQYGRDSFFNVNLSENLIFGIYSFGNNKNYRIAFKGNSYDLFISAWNRDQDKKQIIQDDIRALIRKYEYESNYETNNVEIITETLNELKKLIE